MRRLYTLLFALPLLAAAPAVLVEHTIANDLKGGYSAFLALAKDINDKGEITGRAVDPSTGALIAYLAVPVDKN